MAGWGHLCRLRWFFVRVFVISAEGSYPPYVPNLNFFELPKSSCLFNYRHCYIPMSTCGTCWRVFTAGWRSRQQHMDATGHNAPDFECDTCDRYFRSQHAANQHMTDVNHWAESSESEVPEFECNHCDVAFDDEDDLRDHEVKEHFYCDPCNRYFKNWNNINQV